MTEPVTQLPESFDANKAISLSLGMASPLWLAFAGAAVAGSAFWWMSRWTRPDNLEALLALPATSASVPDIVADVDPVAEAAPAARAAVAAIEKAADDLTKLVGVGPKLAASLSDMGVTSFAQIAAWTADDLARFDTALALKGRAARDAWVAQARRFAEV